MRGGRGVCGEAERGLFEKEAGHMAVQDEKPAEQGFCSYDANDAVCNLVLPWLWLSTML